MLYRQGKNAETIALLTSPLARGVGPDKAAGAFVLAMAYHRSGQAEAARRELEEATQWVEQTRATRSNKEFLAERLQLHLLRREALALLNGPARARRPEK